VESTKPRVLVLGDYAAAKLAVLSMSKALVVVVEAAIGAAYRTAKIYAFAL
jgi:hypothetical protein